MKKKTIFLIVSIVFLTAIIWFPALVLATTDNFDKFQYYVKALEYGLKGLTAYFEFIIKLFRYAVGV